MSLPWSNAEVQRVFSQVQLVKSKMSHKIGYFNNYNSKIYTNIMNVYLQIWPQNKIYLEMISKSDKYKDSVEDTIDIDNISVLF